MAGFYPDAPGSRFAIHDDGTQAYWKDNATNTLTQLTQAEISILNDEDGDYLNAGRGANKTLIIIFPEPRSFTGYYVNTSSDNYPGTLTVSSDTTNGLDGTWTNVVANYARDASGNPIPGYRTAANTVAGGVVKAVAFAFTTYWNGDSLFRSVHLYGSTPLTSNPDRLIFWEPVNENATSGAYFDWGNIAQGQSRTKDFRIKNNSASQTATSITVTSAAVTAGMTVLFSSDGVNFSASINIGDLGPGASSTVLQVKRVVPPNEPLQAQACYFTADAASWA